MRARPFSPRGRRWREAPDEGASQRNESVEVEHLQSTAAVASAHLRGNISILV